MEGNIQRLRQDIQAHKNSEGQDDVLHPLMRDGRTNTSTWQKGGVGRASTKARILTLAAL